MNLVNIHESSSILRDTRVNRMEAYKLKIVSLRRYPVKSMMGEELNACELTSRGVFGDRMYGVFDEETGKLANAKNPKKWPTMFQHRSTYVRPISISKGIAPVQIALPNGKYIKSDEHLVDDVLSESFNRKVSLRTPSADTVEFEGYVPKEIEELEDRGTVFSRESPTDTFFDIAM